MTSRHSEPTYQKDVDEIAILVLAKFEELSAKNKPIKDANGVSGWVPLSGIVGVTGKSYLELENLTKVLQILDLPNV